MARFTRWLLVSSAVALYAALWAAPGFAETKPAAAQKPMTPAEAKQKDAEAKAKAIASAQRAYESGTKAFEAGKMAESVGLLSTALSGGGLPASQMAKALYYRGVAHRKQGKPAQAMSDLTTAIWVSGGLSDSDRAQAIEQRAGAYREAGLGDAPPTVARAEPVPSTPAAAAPVVAAAPAAPVAAETQVAAAPAMDQTPNAPMPGAAAAEAAANRAAAKQATSGSVWQSNPFDSAPPAAPAAAAPPAVQAPVEVAVAPPATDLAPAPTVATAPAVVAPAPAVAEPAPSLAALPAVTSEPAPSEPSVLSQAGKSISQAGNSIGNFFGNIFNSQGGTQTPAEPAGSAVAATAPEPLTSSSEVMTAQDPNGAATSAGWADTTKVQTAAVARTATPGPQTGGQNLSTGAIRPAATAPPVAKGKYKLQVAAVRSRAEAEGLAQQLRSQYGASLNGREPLVDEAVIGGFGTLYRVRVGPYADANEPNKLCSAIKPGGFDCLVVTQ